MGTGRRTRRVGVLYLVLAVGGMAGAVGVALRFELPVAETVAALLPSVGGLYLSWAAFRADRRDVADGYDMARIADRLALAVRGQWESEARVRRLNDPYPLPVSWRAADPGFGESWPLLREMAGERPSGRPAPPSGWATGPAGLAGTGGEITEVFLERVPTRRLVVLGGPGSGKTMLLVRLLLALVAERAEGGPVPVLFPLASWNPAEQTLESWMAERLARDYSGLGSPEAGYADHPDRAGHAARAGQGQRPGQSQGQEQEQVSLARALLEHRLILPVLDGFDEIPTPFRAMALDAINAALPLGRPLVLSSRVTEYGDTLAPARGVPVRLSGAAAVELRPLDAPDIAGYLKRDSGGQETAAAARWDPVIRLLGGDAPVARALTTPLMLFLARTVYNPRPGEQAAVLPTPADLCDPVRFPGAAAVRAHLFDAFVPAAYRPHPRYPCRWSPQQAEHALRYLARHLQHTLGGTTDLAWWQVRRALPSRIAQVVTGVVLGVVAWTAATVVGRLTALLAGLDSGWQTGPPAAMVAGLAGGIAGGIGCGLVAGVTGGVAEGATHVLTTGQPGWLATTLAYGLAYGFAGGIVGALSSRLAARRPGAPPGGPGIRRRRWWASGNRRPGAAAGTRRPGAAAGRRRGTTGLALRWARGLRGGGPGRHLPGPGGLRRRPGSGRPARHPGPGGPARCPGLGGSGRCSGPGGSVGCPRSGSLGRHPGPGSLGRRLGPGGPARCPGPGSPGRRCAGLGGPAWCPGPRAAGPGTGGCVPSGSSPGPSSGSPSG
ncbi:NACHT domain-containing protein [Streptomyces sp. GMY02]|uniref:NACHT domain-containing protein n=1 Tax=Streptomyces sp. GMY02 TaxID=1333528 RepID=UPI001C2C6905|nr:NACHT domain-containing protein [Streptomyces sp. GMY02]QXE36099.1 NACHT domain-containing protein [Streptomyces sp. GMY02]